MRSAEERVRSAGSFHKPSREIISSILGFGVLLLLFFGIRKTPQQKDKLRRELIVLVPQLLQQWFYSLGFNVRVCVCVCRVYTLIVVGSGFTLLRFKGLRVGDLHGWRWGDPRP